MAKNKEKFLDISIKPEAELLKSVADSRAKLRQMTFDHQAGKVKNTTDIKNVKKSIARALTALNQKKSK